MQQTMTEIKDCLPENARRHFIDLRNIRLDSETTKYHERLRNLRAEGAARGQGLRSGWQEMEAWKYKQDLSDSLATGYVQDAFNTCEMYDIPITKSMCNCLLRAVEDHLALQYQIALSADGQGSGVRVPMSVRQQGVLTSKKILPQIRVTIEAARVADEKKRSAIAEKKGKLVPQIYSQNITQHGGVMNASMTGNVAAQQVIVVDFDKLRPALAEMRLFFKRQENSLDADEAAGLLAGAEKAAAQKDESKMLNYLKLIPSKAWDIGKAVIPKVLLHYLNLHGMA